GNAVYLLQSDGEGDFPTVPDVTGLPQAEAEQALREAGYQPLVFNKPTANPDEVGVVLAQSPSGGEEVEPGQDVQVVIQVGVPRATEDDGDDGDDGGGDEDDGGTEDDGDG